MVKKDAPGRQALVYSPEKVAWATSEFIRTPPAWTARVFIYSLVAAIFAAVVYSHLSVVAVSVEARGALVTEQGIFRLKAPGTFKIGRLYAKKNELVKKDQILAESEDQFSDYDYRQLTNQVRQLQKIIEDEKSGNCGKCLQQLKNIADTGFRSENKGQIRDTIVGIQDLVRDLVTSKTNQLNVPALTASLQRQAALAESKLKEIKKQKAEKILAMQVEQLNSEITQAKTQIAEKKQGLKTQVEQTRNKIESRLSGILPAVEQYRAQQKIISPIDGVISDMQISGVGQLIQAGQDLIEVVPQKSELVAEINVANRDISQIKVGLETKIKLDALPEREYGIVEGVVAVLPQNITAEAAGGSVAGGSSTYKVQIRLERQSLNKDGQEYPFKLGMTLVGLVVTKHESLLKLGVKKLFNIKDELINQ